MQRHLRRLLDDSDLPGDARDLFDELLVRVVATMADVAERRQDEQVRRPARPPSPGTAIFMAWEASREHPTSAAWALAFPVARHKLLPRDPLRLEGWTDQAELLARVVGEVPLSQAEAMQLLPA
ncbi:hypothetical protein P4203_18870 [Pseudomonas aeruginosa]|nr:hypothetical protein [Pseudomonas aeruginosa]